MTVASESIDASNDRLQVDTKLEADFAVADTHGQQVAANEKTSTDVRASLNPSPQPPCKENGGSSASSTAVDANDQRVDGTSARKNQIEPKRHSVLLSESEGFNGLSPRTEMEQNDFLSPMTHMGLEGPSTRCRESLPCSEDDASSCGRRSSIWSQISGSESLFEQDDETCICSDESKAGVMGLTLLRRRRKHGLLVKHVREGGPAWKEGSIEVGDVIWSIDGVSFKEHSSSNNVLADMMRGPHGSLALLEVRKSGPGRVVKRVTVRRECCDSDASDRMSVSAATTPTGKEHALCDSIQNTASHGAGIMRGGSPSGSAPVVIGGGGRVARSAPSTPQAAREHRPEALVGDTRLPYLNLSLLPGAGAAAPRSRMLDLGGHQGGGVEVQGRRAIRGGGCASGSHGEHPAAGMEGGGALCRWPATGACVGGPRSASGGAERAAACGLEERIPGWVQPRQRPPALATAPDPGSGRSEGRQSEGERRGQDEGGELAVRQGLCDEDDDGEDSVGDVGCELRSLQEVVVELQRRLEAEEASTGQLKEECEVLRTREWQWNRVKSELEGRVHAGRDALSIAVKQNSAIAQELVETRARKDTIERELRAEIDDLDVRLQQAQEDCAALEEMEEQIRVLKSWVQAHGCSIGHGAAAQTDAFLNAPTSTARACHRPEIGPLEPEDGMSAGIDCQELKSASAERCDRWEVESGDSDGEMVEDWHPSWVSSCIEVPLLPTWRDL